MKANAILIITSIFLTSCQASSQSVKVQKKYKQSSFSASQSALVQHTDNDQPLSRREAESKQRHPQQSLWDFIGDELEIEVPDNPRIHEQRSKYLKNKNYLHNVALRAEPYIYWIIKQIKKRNMPMELALLPVVESAFNPKATSPANAAGLWQIMPQTGRNYGLKQNQWYDGRRDFLASTNAALDIIQHLNKMFGSDWLLIFAAYNSGEGRVMRAVRANKDRDRSTEFWALTLPRETSIYVPKMLALSDILKHRKEYGINLPRPSEDRALTCVEVGQQMQLNQIAEMAGISLSKLKLFNTGYKKNVTAPNGPHYIILPKAHASQLKNSLADGNTTRSNCRKLDQLVTLDQAQNSARFTPVINRLRLQSD